MKRNRVLQIHFQDFGGFEEEIRTALSRRKHLVQPKNQIVFDSLSSFRKFMTIQKIELLTIIATQKPSSIYELAKLTDRDFAAVLRDCASLEGTGFIKLIDANDPKRTKVPRLAFEYNQIRIFLPKGAYQIEFRDVA